MPPYRRRGRPTRVEAARLCSVSGGEADACRPTFSESRKNIARACGDEISEMQPALDARLEDGSRVAAMFPPCSVDGPTLTVRKFTHRYSLDELVTVGTLSASLAETLVAAVRDRKNILISGGTGTGKTTLLNALAATIPASDRIVLIEETSEILIEQPNLVRFEARRAQAPLG